MIKGCKICGITEPKTLNFLINHPFPPKFIGFICNYPKSQRYVEYKNLKNLVSINPKQSSYVAVLVKPNIEILEKIKNLPFDYYQIYDCNLNEIKAIKTNYNKKIISAITIEKKEDVDKYKDFISVSDIILFDSKGYEKSRSWNHNWLKDVTNINKMVAGNIQFDDEIEKLKNICNYIDISGGIESSGLKDISKINIFFNKLEKINNEN